MSRIGKQPIAVPSGVEVTLNGGDRNITVKGPKGTLSFQWRPEVSVAHDEGSIQCSISEGTKNGGKSRALWGTSRSRIQNMVTGVTQGFERKLRIVGVGWNAQPQGKSIRLNIGFCHPVDVTPPDGVDFAIENNTSITITGPDKQAVGEFAAVIRSKRKPEPYNGKGIMYHDEIITRKQGKVFGA
jgi:large subunit ribosomal protein L6